MKQRMMTVVLALVALAASLAWSVSRANRPSDVQIEATHRQKPATVASISATKPGELLPEEFAIFQTHNAFAKAGQSAGGAEAMFVLRGVVKAGDVFTAFIQNLGDKQIARVAIGDAVARGKIKTIALDSIEYEVSGESKSIPVGQDLNGQAAAPTSRPSAVPPAAPEPNAGAGGPTMQGPPQMPPQIRQMGPPEGLN